MNHFPRNFLLLPSVKRILDTWPDPRIAEQAREQERRDLLASYQREFARQTARTEERMAKRYCEMCDEWRSKPVCPECGMPTRKAEKGGQS